MADLISMEWLGGHEHAFWALPPKRQGRLIALWNFRHGGQPMGITIQGADAKKISDVERMALLFGGMNG